MSVSHLPSVYSRNLPSLCLGVALLLAVTNHRLIAQDSCNLPSTVSSLLPNPSLEEYHSGQDGCYSQQLGGLPDGTNQANCLVGWQKISLGTTDAWNAFTFPSAGPGFPSSLPQPLPSGSSVAGFWVGIKDSKGNQFRNGDRSWARQYREYLGACFDENSRLEAGLDYRLTFHLGFMEPEIYRYQGRHIDVASPSGVELSLYGVRSCSQLDFGSFYDCPETAGATGYELIATITVEGDAGSWTPVTVDFVSAGDYEAFAIGGSCGNDIGRANNPYYRNYYFIDDLILNRTAAFSEPVAGPVSISGQSICADVIELSGQAMEGATYQWFHNGAAVAGGDSSSLTLVPTPDIDGAYHLRIESALGCATTGDVNIQRPVIHDQFPDSVALCGTGGQVTVFPSQQSSGTYTWSDGSTNSYYTITEPGTYSVTISTACIQQVETFEATEDSEISYRYTISPEAPCVGDTVELMLETDWYVPLVMFTLGDDERYYVTPNTPVQVVAGSIDSVSAFVITSCGYYDDRVAIPQLSPWTAAVNVLDLNCQGPTGEISLDLGAESPTTIEWRAPDGMLLAAGGPALSVDQPGTYTATLWGAGHCPTVITAEVTDRAFGVEVLTSDVSCADDGSATALPVGGTPPYAIEWITGADQPLLGHSVQTLNHLPRGDYVTRVRDGNGCETDATFTIDGPDPLTMQAEVAIAGCSPDQSATLNVIPRGGTAPYSYSITGRAPVPQSLITDLSAGAYEVAVTDANNCVSDPWETTIDFPEPVTVRLSAASHVNLGQSAAIELSLTGCDPAEALIFWDADSDLSFPDGPLRAVTVPEATARYAIEVVTPDNCVYTDEVSVTVLDATRAYVPNAFSPNGDGRNDLLELYPNSGVAAVEHFRVFDRWGALVWEKTGEAVAWDGTRERQPLNTGTYFYEGQLRTRRGDLLPVRGTVQLLR